MTASKLARILTISVVLAALSLGGTAHAQDGDTLSQPAGITQSDPSQLQPDEPTPQPPGTPEDPAAPEDQGTMPESTTTTRPEVVRPKSLPVTVSPREGRPGTTRVWPNAIRPLLRLITCAGSFDHTTGHLILDASPTGA